MPKGKNRQLTLENRIFIEDRIKARDSLSEVARRLGVSASTVSREVKRNRVPESPGYRVAHENLCRKAAECTVAGLCGTGCLAPCRKCRKGPSTCNALCPDFAPRPCPQLDRPPFCCNTCYRRYGGGCGHPTLFYDGRSADELARRRLSESRGGIGITREELLAMDELVTPLVRRGQSPSAIWATHSDELPVGVRTYYTYVDAGIMTCANIDLPKKVRFRPGKGRRGRPADRGEAADLGERLYSDFLALPDGAKAASWQMDCVEGRAGESPALLTLSFPPARPAARDAADQEGPGQRGRRAGLAGVAARGPGGVLRRLRHHTDRPRHRVHRPGQDRAVPAGGAPLPRVLLRPDAVHPEGVLRAQPRRAPQDRPQGDPAGRFHQGRRGPGRQPPQLLQAPGDGVGCAA